MIKLLVSALAGSALLPAAVAFAQASDNAIATGIDFDMDEAVAPSIKEYSDCLSKNRPMVINGKPTHAVAIERAISTCKETRKQMMAEANSALVRNPAWADPAKRALEVASAFDNTDASGRKLARETDAYNSKRGNPK